MTKEIDRLSDEVSDLTKEVSTMTGYLRAKLPPNGKIVACTEDIATAIERQSVACQSLFFKHASQPPPQKKINKQSAAAGGIGALLTALAGAITYFVNNWPQ